jgi:hypothetical protein
MLGRSAVLVIQDTATLSYTEHPSVRGLGPVNDSARARGFLAQRLARPSGPPREGCVQTGTGGGDAGGRKQIPSP